MLICLVGGVGYIGLKLFCVGESMNSGFCQEGQNLVENHDVFIGEPIFKIEPA